MPPPPHTHTHTPLGGPLSRSEDSIPGADQKDHSLWGRDCIVRYPSLFCAHAKCHHHQQRNTTVSWPLRVLEPTNINPRILTSSPLLHGNEIDEQSKFNRLHTITYTCLCFISMQTMMGNDLKQISSRRKNWENYQL